MLIQPTVGRLTRLFQQTQLLIIALKRFLKRANQGVDSLLTLHQVTVRFDMKSFERHGGELQERFVVLFQCFPGKGLERSHKFLALMVEQVFLFGEVPRSVFHAGFRSDAGLLNHRQFLTKGHEGISFKFYLLSQLLHSSLCSLGLGTQATCDPESDQQAAQDKSSSEAYNESNCVRHT